MLGAVQHMHVQQTNAVHGDKHNSNQTQHMHELWNNHKVLGFSQFALHASQQELQRIEDTV